jgi:hypothetical protein
MIIGRRNTAGSADITRDSPYTRPDRQADENGMAGRSFLLRDTRLSGQSGESGEASDFADCGGRDDAADGCLMFSRQAKNRRRIDGSLRSKGERAASKHTNQEHDKNYPHVSPFSGDWPRVRKTRDRRSVLNRATLIVSKIAQVRVLVQRHTGRNSERHGRQVDSRRVCALRNTHHSRTVDMADGYAVREVKR